MKKIMTIALLVIISGVAYAQSVSTKKHKVELHVNMGAFTSGKMTTAWPKPYDMWRVFPSRLNSAGVGYRVGQHFVFGADIRAGFMLADNKVGAKIYGTTETAWMMLSAGLFADCRVSIGRGNIYIGLSGYKSGSYDHPSKPKGRIVIGEGWVYGPHVGFNAPISKSIFLYAQVEHSNMLSKGMWYKNPMETKVSGVPVVAGIRFRL